MCEFRFEFKIYKKKLSELWILNDIVEQKEFESLCRPHSDVQITAHMVQHIVIEGIIFFRESLVEQNYIGSLSL